MNDDHGEECGGEATTDIIDEINKKGKAKVISSAPSLIVFSKFKEFEHGPSWAPVPTVCHGDKGRCQQAKQGNRNGDPSCHLPDNNSTCNKDSLLPQQITSASSCC